MRIARSMVPPAVVIAAVLGTAVVSVAGGGRPLAAASAASVVSVHQTPGHAGHTRHAGHTGQAGHAGQQATGPAAAQTPGWRVVAKFGAVHGVLVAGAITASSARAAWSVWTGQGYTEVARWTGTAWLKVPLPARLTPYAHAAVAFAGDSASDFWLFSGYSRTRVLRWTGRSWKLQPIPSWVLQRKVSATEALVFGPGNVWVFGVGPGAAGYAAHYTGRAWAKVSLPGIPLAVTGLAASDIWVAGKSSVVRWNGRRWVPVGGIPPVAIPCPCSYTVEDFTASSATDAWLASTALDTKGNPLGRFLFHWNGRSWSIVARPANLQLGSLVPDGAGGLWASGSDPHAPGGFFLFYRLTGGHWTEVDPPAPVFDHGQEYLTWIPGTRSLWGVATGYTPKDILDTLILKYGA
jgi:hypothetical protein